MYSNDYISAYRLNEVSRLYQSSATGLIWCRALCFLFPLKKIRHPQEAHTFSSNSYNSEFAEHPDLTCTWAVDSAFLAHFAEGFAAYKSGDWQAACEILEETRKARRTADGRKVRSATEKTCLCLKCAGGQE